MNGERSRFEGQILDTYGFVRKSGYSVSPNTTAQVQRREHRWEIVYGRKNYQKSSVLKRFCRKGVPKDKRIAVWLTVSETGDGPSYEQRFRQACSSPCQPDFKSVIFEDLRRTFPDNSNFHGGSQSERLMGSLKLVLEAFASFRPDPGYCQGMNSIAATFILLRGTELDCFTLLDRVIFHIVPSSYYSSNLKGLRIERLVFKSLVQKYCPQQFARIEQFSGFELYFDKWFVCLFIDCLPMELALRIWDMLFYESFKVFHRAALTIIHRLKDEILATNDFMVLADLFSSLKDNPKFYNSQAFVIEMKSLTSSLSINTVSALRNQMRSVVEKEIEEHDMKLRKRQEEMARKRESEQQSRKQESGTRQRQTSTTVTSSANNSVVYRNSSRTSENTVKTVPL
ncbi:growth hormone-regulated TBC protein 1-like [Convolutriloba macropyga]|uniref:growth hormone-regulated TBC protein 1-like n=1 Tax=Convolutriloba macropyga TaxID=536237 RepID=UPI003F5237BE